MIRIFLNTFLISMAWFLPIIVIVSLVSLAFGVFLSLQPVQAIELQKKIYLRINWHMEPVNMAKEIRNTQIMGLLAVFVSILADINLFQLILR